MTVRGELGVFILPIVFLTFPVLATENCSPTPRMPPAKSEAIKRSMLPQGGRMADFELDHIRPLALGGSNDRSNLQLQSWPEAKRKDVVEWRLIRAVRHNQISCNAAVKMIEAWRP